MEKAGEGIGDGRGDRKYGGGGVNKKMKLKMNTITEDKIKEIFYEQFYFIKDKFTFYNFSVTDYNFLVSNKENINKPGVYIFYMYDQIWKVGKHLLNAKKRALEHFRDDTGANIGKGMKQYEHDENMNLILIIPNKDEDIFWILSIEYYFESRFKAEHILQIPSKRNG